MRSPPALGLALTAAALACGVNDGITESDTINGIKYSARVTTITSIPSDITPADTQINVIATLANVSTTSQDRTYPVGCAVRVRLYRASDGARLYDETKKPCANATQATLSIGIGEGRDLASGVRIPATMLGDSLPFTTYRVRAVVMTEGSGREMEVVAGNWTFRPRQ